MIKLIYILLKSLEFLIFWIYGKKISRANTKKEYWRMASVPILTYAVVEGLRFGRNVDWNVYYFRYLQLGMNVSFLDDYEILFRYIVHLFYQCGIPYWGFIFFQCLFFISCVFILVENFKKDSRWIIPLILVCVTSNENFIRWYLGFSFILLAISSLIKEKRILSIIWFVCALSCHSGLVFFGGILILYKILNKYAIPNKIAVCLLFITTFLISLSDLMFITRITSFLSPILGNSLNRGGYLDATESLLNGTWGQVGIMEQSSAYYFRIFIMYAPVIYWGYKIISQYKFGYLFYNLFVVGAICSPLFGLIEIFNRISSSLNFFFCIVGGVFYIRIIENKTSKKNIVFVLSIISLLFAIYPYFSDMLSRKDNFMMFIWDANGRNFLQH